jgi:hypothetical protein
LNETAIRDALPPADGARASTPNFVFLFFEKRRFHFNRITESRGFSSPPKGENGNPQPPPQANSPRYLWGVGRGDEKDMREKRKNVNEPAGSSSFYPCRVGALRERDPLDSWCIGYDFVMNNRIP